MGAVAHGSCLKLNALLVVLQAKYLELEDTHAVLADLSVTVSSARADGVSALYPDV